MKFRKIACVIVASRTSGKTESTLVRVRGVVRKLCTETWCVARKKRNEKNKKKEKERKERREG